MFLSRLVQEIIMRSSVLLTAMLIAVLYLGDVSARRITLYNQARSQGASKTYTFTKCVSTTNFNDKAVSISSNGCVIVYENVGCKGKSLRVERDAFSCKENLGSCNFTNKVSSMIPCQEFMQIKLKVDRPSCGRFVPEYFSFMQF